MVPLAQSWWLADKVEVPVQDVVDSLAAALNKPDASGGACGAGALQFFFFQGHKQCVCCFTVGCGLCRGS